MNGFRTWNIGLAKRKIIQILAMGRTMVVLALLSILLFVVLGIGGLAEQKLNSSPVSSMKGLAASLSSGFFTELLGMEVPHLKAKQTEDTEVFSAQNMSNFVFQLLTNVNPADPKSLVAREVPGLGTGGPILLRGASGTQTPTAPEDYRTDIPEEQKDGGIQAPDSGSGNGNASPSDSANGGKAGAANGDGNTGAAGAGNGANGSGNGNDGAAGSGSAGTGAGGDKSGSTGGKSGSGQTADNEPKAVMIYHSHPHESYNPLLNSKSDNPSSADPAKNVGLVGDLISAELEKKGVGAFHDFEDYMKTVKGYNYNYSYKYSRVTVKEALAEYNDLHYFFDIHRDSQSYGKTTATIGGVSYAQVYFIIGHGNPDWRKNEAFANRIYDRLEKSYPGLSRGIWGKTNAQGNGEYNQSLSPNSVLIEVGGIDNTKEELQRTAKVLADVIADIYFEDQKAEKANAVPVDSGTQVNAKNGTKTNEGAGHS